MRVYLGLGSNLGDREENLQHAIAAIRRNGVRIVQQSSLYVTEPLELRQQPWFLNCVVEAETRLMPRELLSLLRHVESEAGRKRLLRSGPRVLDIDILFFGGSVMTNRWLQVPHPRIGERRFVLLPLLEIAPHLRHPKWHRTIHQLLVATKDRSIVRRWSGPPKSQAIPL